MPANWFNQKDLIPKSFICGFCDHKVASDKGFADKDSSSVVYLCPSCNKPTFFKLGDQVPGIAPGNDVEHLPESVGYLYKEARRCISIQAYTSAVLSCRKLLMNIAVEQGAEEGKKFIYYVEYLAEKGYVPPNGRLWVDHIRKKGNEATHEIVVMNKSDAVELVSFSEMLLKFVYEFPAKIPEE